MAEERRILSKQARAWYALFLPAISDLDMGKPSLRQQYLSAAEVMAFLRALSDRFIR